MRIGDEVIVDNPRLKSYGKAGRVSCYAAGCLGPSDLVEVRLDNGKVITIKRQNLTACVGTTLSGKESEQKDKNNYLAFVHYHDCDQNPNSIEEVLDFFDEDDLCSCDLCVYGTKEEILEQIKEDGSRLSYENVFIIVDGKVFPVETSIFVDW